jgi:hypothetical protein
MEHTPYILYTSSASPAVFRITEQINYYAYISVFLYSTITIVSDSHPKLRLSVFYYS